MKIRNGFVSNSSSSSFMVNKRNLTELQIEMIYDHINVAKQLKALNPELDLGYIDEYDAWGIEDKVDYLFVFTFMNNFDMGGFLIEIGVPKDDIEWEDY